MGMIHRKGVACRETWRNRASRQPPKTFCLRLLDNIYCDCVGLQPVNKSGNYAGCNYYREYENSDTGLATRYCGHGFKAVEGFIDNILLVSGKLAAMCTSSVVLQIVELLVLKHSQLTCGLHDFLSRYLGMLNIPELWTSSSVFTDAIT